MKPYILIIEDEEDIRESLRDVLEQEGYLVMTANSGKNAIEVLEVSPKFNLILLDLMMPVMSGEEFVAINKIRNITQGTPIVIMSADNQTAQRAAKMDIKTFVKKPLDLDDLLRIIKESCR